jgi:hypothetical protein
MPSLLNSARAGWLSLGFAIAVGIAAPAPAGDSIRMLVQSSPLAGSQYYALGRLRSQMHEGDALTLEREPDNRHDANAILVRWQGEKLGYLPRRENAGVAAAIDCGEKVRGRIRTLRDSPDPWRQLEIDVFLEF